MTVPFNPLPGVPAITERSEAAEWREIVRIQQGTLNAQKEISDSQKRSLDALSHSADALQGLYAIQARNHTALVTRVNLLERTLAFVAFVTTVVLVLFVVAVVILAVVL